jgi:CubicO group peptidase (beta-lactamase class C family)
VLGLVIEAASGKPYHVAVEDLILKPLGLTRTSVRPPRDVTGNVVAPDAAWWNYDQGVQNP